jgi:hypothetical protein
LVKSKNDAATVTVTMENRGVAPFYYAWPVGAEFLDAGKVVGEGHAVWPLPELLPGETAQWSISVDSGNYRGDQVLLRIANPMKGGHAVAFANAEMGTVRAGWLTLNVAR